MIPITRVALTPEFATVIQHFVLPLSLTGIAVWLNKSFLGQRVDGLKAGVAAPIIAVNATITAVETKVTSSANSVSQQVTNIGTAREELDASTTKNFENLTLDGRQGRKEVEGVRKDVRAVGGDIRTILSVLMGQKRASLG
ncbi:MAG: hypothetical protein Q9221_008276 [Calogaya cf. arnoldii]